MRSIVLTPLCSHCSLTSSWTTQFSSLYRRADKGTGTCSIVWLRTELRVQFLLGKNLFPHVKPPSSERMFCKQYRSAAVVILQGPLKATPSPAHSVLVVWTQLGLWFAHYNQHWMGVGMGRGSSNLNRECGACRPLNELKCRVIWVLAAHNGAFQRSLTMIAVSSTFSTIALWCL